MSSFAQLRRALKLPCADKTKYPTYADAVDVATKRTTPGEREFAKFLQPYRCEHELCRGYHLTSKPFRDRIHEWPVIGDFQE